MCSRIWGRFISPKPECVLQYLNWTVGIDPVRTAWWQLQASQDEGEGGEVCERSFCLRTTLRPKSGEREEENKGDWWITAKSVRDDSNHVSPLKPANKLCNSRTTKEREFYINGCRQSNGRPVFTCADFMPQRWHVHWCDSNEPPVWFHTAVGVWAHSKSGKQAFCGAR